MTARPATDPVDRIARQLADAAATCEAIVELDPAPRDLAEAYRVQAAGHALHGESLIGWKAGATTTAAQEFLKITAPVSGRYRDTDVVESPASLSMTQFVMPPRLEVEVGIRLLHDIDVPPDDPTELADAVDAFAAIEVVAGRLASFPLLPAPDLVADNVVGAKMIVGPSLGLDASALRDLDGMVVSLDIDGIEVASGTGADALGHPLHVLAWLVGHAAELGTPLRAGELVITGTCTGMVSARAGARHTGHVGRVSVHLDME